MSGAVTTMRRPAGDRVILGVCAAVARRTDLDVTLVRVIAGIGLVVLTVPLLVAYAGLALVVPRSDGRMLLGGEPTDRRESLIGWTLVAAAAGLVIATPSLFGLGGDVGLFGIGALVLAVGLIGIAVSRGGSRSADEGAGPADAGGPGGTAVREQAAETAARRDAETAVGERTAETAVQEAIIPAAPRGPSIFAPALGGVTAALGLGAVVVAVFDISLTAIAVAVIAGSLAVTCGGLAIAFQERRGTIPLLALGSLLALIAVVAAVGRDEFDRGIGYREVRPLTAADVEAGYDYGIGFMQVDLRDLDLPPGRTTMPLHIGFGAAEVLVPADLQVTSTGDRISGEVPVDSPPSAGVTEDIDGKREDRRAGAAAEPPTLVIAADVNVGEIEISRRGGG